MAVLKNLVLAASVISSLVAAAPMAGHNKREIYTNTVTEIAWITVEETTTVWVNPSDPTPAPQAPQAAVVTTTSSNTAEPTTMQTVAAAPQAPPAVPSEAPAAAYTAPAQPPPAASSSTPYSPPSSAAPSVPSMTLQPKATVGTDGTCEGSGDACTGDVTHWDGGKLTLSPLKRPR
jgi:hypothetical protein